MNKLILIPLLFALTACFGGGSDDSESPTDDGGQETPIVQPELTPTSFSGTAATGLAIEGATVTFTDQNGNAVTPVATVTTDASGNYTANFSDTFSVPLIVTITTDTGSLKTIVDDVTQTVVNINPVTNFVADKVIETVGIENVSSGAFKTEGQTVVEAAFGTGVDFDAFSTKSFVAQNADNTTEPSPADVILDALADTGEEGIDSVLSEAIAMDKPLLESTQFQVEVAKAASNTTLSGSMTTLLTSTNADTTQAIANIDSFTDIISTKKTEVLASLVDEELSAEEQALIVNQVIDLASDLVEEDLSSGDALQNLLDNSDELFTDQLTEAVNNIDEGVTDEQAAQILVDIGVKIVTIVQVEDIDLAIEDTTLPTTVTDVISNAVSNPEVVEDTSRWGKDWDTLVWQ